MIDWFKIELMNRPADELRQKLDFINPVILKTRKIVGTHEIAYIQLYDVKDCAISVKIFRSGRVWVQGSIHKFWDGHNHSVFTIDEALKAFVQLFEILGAHPTDAKILQIEYGVNLCTPFDPDAFINRLICFKYKPFEGMGNYEKIGKVCYQNEYDLKIYNKGKQYNLKRNILRVEKKVKDSRHLKRFEITTIADLTDSKVEEMLKDLLGCLDDVLIDDKSIDEDKLTTRQKLALSKYRNSSFWSELNRAVRLNTKKKFANLITKYGGETFPKTIKILLENSLKNHVQRVDVLDDNKNNEELTFWNFKYGSETSIFNPNKY